MRDEYVRNTKYAREYAGIGFTKGVGRMSDLRDEPTAIV